MRALRQCVPSRSMAVAMTAWVVAVGGMAIAADGGFVNDDGQIQGCVAEKNLVNSLTDPVVSGLSQVVTPQGALLVRKPGEDCPAGTKALSFASNALPKVFASGRREPATLGKGKGKAEVAGAMLDAGDYVVNATAVISNPGISVADRTIKCALVDSAGKTIKGTTSNATIPAGTKDSRLTLPITAVVSDVPAGEISLQCKNAESAGKNAESAGAAGSPAVRAAAASVTSQECKDNGGRLKTYPETELEAAVTVCDGGTLERRRVMDPPTSTGTVHASKSEAGGSASVDLHGCPAGNFCVWAGPHFDGASKFVLADKGPGQCYEVNTPGGYHSVANNTDRPLAVFDSTDGLTQWP